MTGDDRITVYLLDDHEVVREGLRHLIEADGDMAVVGEAGTAETALREVPEKRPRVAVLDVRLPDGNGVEVCRDLRSACPEVACLMLTSFSDDDAILDASMAGAAGYVLKEIRASDLLDGIRRVAVGDSLLDSVAAVQAMDRARQGRRGADSLTPQEAKILGLVAEGLTNRQIADAMFLSEKTVKNYVSNLLGKLGMSRRTEAAVYAVKQRREPGPR